MRMAPSTSVRARIAQVMVFAAAGLLAADRAAALSMTVVSSEIVVDGYARAGSRVDDPESDSGENLEITIALAILAESQLSGVGSSSAQAQHTPFLDNPKAMRTQTTLRASARASDAVTSESEGTSAGMLRLRMSDEAGDTAGSGLGFALVLDGDAAGNASRVTYRVFNETRGTNPISIDTDSSSSIPTEFAVPVSAGDMIRIEWSAELSAFAASGQRVAGELGFESRIAPVVVPEPVGTVLAAVGLLILGAVRSRTAPR